MKKIFLILSVLIFLTFACSKNVGEKATNSLQGTWELRGTAYETYPANAGNQIILTGNKFKYYQQGKLTDSGNYQTKYDTKDSFGNWAARIYFHSTTDSIFYHLTKDTLVFDYPGIALQYDKYVKIKN